MRADPMLVAISATLRLLPVLAVVGWMRGVPAAPFFGLGLAAWALSSLSSARSQTVQAAARGAAVRDAAEAVVARAPTRVGLAHQDAFLVRLLRAMYARVRRASETGPTVLASFVALPIALGLLVLARGPALPLAATLAGLVGVVVRVPLARRHRRMLDGLSVRYVALAGDLGRGVRALEDLHAHGLSSAYLAHNLELSRAVAEAEAKAARAGLLAVWVPLLAAGLALGAGLGRALLGPRSEVIVMLVTLATLAPMTVALARALANDAALARDTAPLDALTKAPPDLPAPAAPLPLPASLVPVALEHVRFAFPTPRPEVASEGSLDETRPAVLDDVTLRWSGERPLVLVGPNGAGKSTLLSILLRLDDPERGTVRFGGVDVRELATEPLRARMAFVPQRPLVFGAATVREALRMVAPTADDAALIAALREVALYERLARRGDPLSLPAQALSVGESRRLSLARAIVRDAELWVLDEPEAGLDPAGRAALRTLLEARARGGVRLILAVQHPEVAPEGSVVIELPLAPGSVVDC